MPPLPAVRTSAQTVVAQGVRVEGDFQGQGDIVIDGEVKGNISTNGLLTIGTHAHVQADVDADSATVAGRVDGNVNVKAHLELKATAKVKGDVRCATATIESGAVLQGTISIGGDATTSAPTKDESESPDSQSDE